MGGFLVMRKIMLLAIIALWTTACSSGTDDQPSCSRTDRTGTYLQHFVEHDGGTCGTIPDELSTISGAGSGAGPGCSLDAPDRWSDGDCSLERNYTCPVDTVCVGCKVKFTAITHEGDDGGARLIGTIGLTGINPDGSIGCVSVYDLTATRQ
jgi:hypothetical protein